MFRIVLSLFLLALPSAAQACPQAMFGYGYTQAYYAPQQYYAQQTQAYVQSDVLARIAALRAELAALEAQATQQYTQQQTAYAYTQPVIVERFAIRRQYARQQLAVVDVGRGVVRRALDFVFGGPRPAPLRQQIHRQQLRRQFRRGH